MMPWIPSDKDRAAVLALGADGRYAHLVREAVDEKELCGLCNRESGEARITSQKFVEFSASFGPSWDHLSQLHQSQVIPTTSEWRNYRRCFHLARHRT